MAMRPLIFFLAIFALLFQAPIIADTPEHLTLPGSDSVLDTLALDHPRIILTSDRISELKELYQTDPDFQTMAEDVITQADNTLDLPDLQHRLIGPRLLSVSTACVKRVRTFSLAYLLTGDTKYAEKAEKDLLTVCAFPDWNPSHFLDTAEMTHAVGLGYDWLYDFLSDESRNTIREGLIRNGFLPALDAYENDGHWFPRQTNNWNQVCNGGMIIGALAVADEEADYASHIISPALKSLPLAMVNYAPDGAWLEGPGYWNYATRYAAYCFTALETALGTDFGFFDSPGLSESGYFPLYLSGPTGEYLNFADSAEGSSLHPLPCLFWFASTYDIPFLALQEHKLIDDHGATAEDLMWYLPKPMDDQESLPLDRYFGGPVEIATLRSSWDDPNAIFIGIKAGYNQAPHGHLDLGNFEFDMMGVRWAVDLGRDNYNLPGYWDMDEGGTRWDYYRLNSASHNVITINNLDQGPFAESHIVYQRLNEDDPVVRIDLTDVWKDFSDNTTRQISLHDGRSYLRIDDVIELTGTSDVTWGMTTPADIEITDNGDAILTLEGKRIIAKLVRPGTAEFSTGSAEQEPPDRSNEGYSRLLIDLPDSSGRLQISVIFEPSD